MLVFLRYNIFLVVCDQIFCQFEVVPNGTMGVMGATCSCVAQRCIWWRTVFLDKTYALLESSQIEVGIWHLVLKPRVFHI